MNAINVLWKYPWMVQKKDLLQLFRLSKINGVARICFHQSPNDSLQAMLIVLKKSKRYDFHMHTDKNEIYQILHGSLLIIEKSQEEVMINLSKFATSHHVVKKNIPHSVESLSKYSAFIEISEGPFNPQKTIYKSS